MEDMAGPWRKIFCALLKFHSTLLKQLICIIQFSHSSLGPTSNFLNTAILNQACKRHINCYFADIRTTLYYSFEISPIFQSSTAFVQSDLLIFRYFRYSILLLNSSSKINLLSVKKLILLIIFNVDFFQCFIPINIYIFKIRQHSFNLTYTSLIFNQIIIDIPF